MFADDAKESVYNVAFVRWTRNGVVSEAKVREQREWLAEKVPGGSAIQVGARDGDRDDEQHGAEDDENDDDEDEEEPQGGSKAYATARSQYAAVVALRCEVQGRMSLYSVGADAVEWRVQLPGRQISAKQFLVWAAEQLAEMQYVSGEAIEAAEVDDAVKQYTEGGLRAGLVATLNYSLANVPEFWVSMQTERIATADAEAEAKSIGDDASTGKGRSSGHGWLKSDLRKRFFGDDEEYDTLIPA